MLKLYPEKTIGKFCLFIPFFFLATIASAQPSISSFSPRSGPIGTTVTITGANFSSVAANNIVYFGSGKATVSSATANSLSVVVPAGASYQPITVTTGNLTASSASPFDVTFSGGGTSFSTDSFSAPILKGYMAATWNSVVGDLDGDGKPDVLAFNNSSSQFYIWKNSSGTNGSFVIGSITQGQGSTPGSGPTFLSDLDGDGKPDLLYRDAVLLNTSSASGISFNFGQGTPYSNGSVALAAADLDGDGKPDFISANSDTAMTIAANNSTPGSISFTGGRSYKVDSGAKSIATGDVDGDGKADIVVTALLTGRVTIFRNTSVRGAISLAGPTVITLGGSPDKLVIGDLDADAKADIAITDGNNKKLIILKNVGSTGAISFLNDTSYSCGLYNPTGVALGDIDGDGKVDLAVSTTDAKTLNMTQQYPVVAFKNASSPGSIAFQSGYNYYAGYSLFTIALNDMNGDGKPDMIVADPASAAFEVLLNKTQLDTTRQDTIPAPPDTTHQAPRLISFFPDSARTGTVVSVNGAHLTGATSVSFGGVTAQSFTVVSDSLIHATVGAGATGQVLVTWPYGRDSLQGFRFLDTIPAPPPPDTTHRDSIPPPPDTTRQDTTATPPPAFRLEQVTVSVLASQPVISWRTLNENNVAYYVVQHSTDTTHFSAIGTVTALRKDSASYTFTDQVPRQGLNFYRIMIGYTSWDSSYSQKIVIQLPGIPPTLSGYPNPAVSGMLYVALPSVSNTSKFTLVDMNGNIVKTMQVGANIPQVQLDLSGVRPGIYKLVWSDGTQSSYQSVMIMK